MVQKNGRERYRGLERGTEMDGGLILRAEMMPAHYTSHVITQKPGKDARDRKEN